MAEPAIYVVRIWHVLAGGFRASVRRVDDEVVCYFDAADALLHFLVESPCARATAPRPDEWPAAQPGPGPQG
jgi:hypothetical protein